MRQLNSKPKPTVFFAHLQWSLGPKARSHLPRATWDIHHPKCWTPRAYPAADNRRGTVVSRPQKAIAIRSWLMARATLTPDSCGPKRQLTPNCRGMNYKILKPTFRILNVGDPFSGVSVTAIFSTARSGCQPATTGFRLIAILTVFGDVPIRRSKPCQDQWALGRSTQKLPCYPPEIIPHRVVSGGQCSMACPNLSRVDTERNCWRVVVVRQEKP